MTTDSKVRNDVIVVPYSNSNVSLTLFNETDLDLDLGLETPPSSVGQFVTGRLVPVLFCLIFLIGFIGNIVVMIVSLSPQLMRNTTNVLIANLATADLIFIVICVPFTAVLYAVSTWPFGTVWCKIYQYLINATAYVSVYTLVLMSLDRYLAVVHPVQSLSIRTEHNAYVVSGTLWAMVLLFNVPVILENEQFYYPYRNEVRSTCINVRIYKELDKGRSYGTVFYGCFFAFAYALPLASVCLLYGLMLRRLLQGTSTGKGRRSPGSVRKRSNRRTTRLVVVVVIVFALCWLPLNLVMIVQHSSDYPLANAGVFVPVKIVATCLAYLNSCVNPILYAFLSENFRRTFWKIIGFRRRMKSGEAGMDRPVKRTPLQTPSRMKDWISMDGIQ